MLRARLRDARAAVGWPALAWVAPLSLVRTRYAAYDWEATRHEASPPTLPEVEMRELEPGGDLGLLERMNPRWRPPQVARRLEEGQRCFVWWRDGHPIHARWICDRPTYLEYLDRIFVPRPDERLSVEGYTAPGHRRRGVFTASLRWHQARAVAEGKRHCIGFVADWNRGIARAFEADGHRRRGTVTRYRIGPWRRWRLDGDLREVGDGAVQLRDE